MFTIKEPELDNNLPFLPTFNYNLHNNCWLDFHIFCCSLLGYCHSNKRMNKTSRAGQMTTEPGHSYEDPYAIIHLCVHPLVIQ